MKILWFCGDANFLGMPLCFFIRGQVQYVQCLGFAIYSPASLSIRKGVCVCVWIRRVVPISLFRVRICNGGEKFDKKTGTTPKGPPPPTTDLLLAVQRKENLPCKLPVLVQWPISAKLCRKWRLAVVCHAALTSPPSAHDVSHTAPATVSSVPPSWEGMLRVCRQAACFPHWLGVGAQRTYVVRYPPIHPLLNDQTFA